MPVEAAVAAGTMEITVSKSELLRELTATQGVVERKTTIPILSNYLFEAAGDRLSLKHTTRSVAVIVEALTDRVDVETLERVAAPDALELNDIGRVRLRAAQPLVVDRYEANRATGGFILIDPTTNGTVGAGMIE